MMLPPGSTIGILGGGQLGWMLSIAAKGLGYPCHIFAPEENPPAMQTADQHTHASFDDVDSLKAFSKSVDIITYEFENIPVDPLREIEDFVAIRPSLKSLEISQDRLTEKNFVRSLGIPTAPFEPVDDTDSLVQAFSKIGLPAVLKTRRLGYDGKGQSLLYKQSASPSVLYFTNAWQAVGEVPSIVEKVVNFSQEFAVVIARDEEGNTRCFDVIATYHEGGILRKAKTPAGLYSALESCARDAATAIVDALEHVGILTAEFFLLGDIEDGTDADKRILVNEIAPRVHNSGHLTREICLTNQFEQHIRAICGLNLGDTTRTADAEMTNLLGNEVNGWKTPSDDPGTYITLYGKGDARPGRKMGHVVRIPPLSR